MISSDVSFIRQAGIRPLGLVAAGAAALIGLVAVLLLLPPRPSAVAPTAPGVDEKTAPAAVAKANPGKELYTRHCAACHGDQGDGQGPAARFLYPKPRNFGEAKFRIVTTRRGLPSDEDLAHVIRQGMPGSAMFPFGHLGDEAVNALVGQVRQLLRDRVEERVRQEAKAEGESDPEVIAERLDRLLAVSPPLELPANLPHFSPESAARGGPLYKARGCASCHGDTGKGDGVQAQVNDDGMPTRPRDLTLGIYKGGVDPRQLHARMLRGMPGSPMPGFDQIPPQEIGDIVNYLLSLSTPEIRARGEHRRRTVAARRVPGEFAEEIPEAQWQSAETASVVVTPLWWRNYAEPALQVSALHDGLTVAVRLTWSDPARNGRPLREEDFEDMAAVQLFKGTAEPFLGMGAADGPLDLWLWRAGGEEPFEDRDSILDDYPFDTPAYKGILKGQTARPPDFRTARAAGNPHASRQASGSSLSAKGFGSTTFRPVPSQQVSARGTWANGRWTVVLRRPLRVGNDEGLALAAGERCSVGFALWDGAARDRDGQKLVSIWHDLTLE